MGITANARYSGGTGEPNDPYRIETAEDLNDIGNHLEDFNKNFILANDVNLAQYNGTQFKIIGNNTTKFTGVFNGNNHRIWSFTWSSTGRNYIGLFGCIGTGGQIENLGMENVDVKAGSGAHVGGMVGVNDEAIITNCYSTGSVIGGNNVGGLLGVNRYSESKMTDCYSISSVSGGDAVGGLIGWNYRGTITNCYSTGTTLGNHLVGGLVGCNDDLVNNCYSTGRVSGDDMVGGLVGGHVSYSEVTGSFWDIQTSNQSTSDGGTGKTTAEMKTKTTFTDAGWDLVGETTNGTNDIWRMCVDQVEYPLLRWQFVAGDFVCPDGVNFIDFAVLALAWLSDNIDQHWNPICDISEPKDNLIDELDLAVFCENWLEGM